MTRRVLPVVWLGFVAGCRHRAPAPVVAPAPAPAPQPAAPKTQPRVAKPATPPPAQPRPIPAPPSPAAPNLQSHADASGDRAAIEQRIGSVRSQMDTLSRRTLSAAAAQDRERATAMLNLAQEALSLGNLRQADELSSRAAMLAKTLLNGR